jgi:hypothetical protein
LVTAATLEPVAVAGSAFAPGAPVVPIFAPGGTRVAAYLLEAADERSAYDALSDAALGAMFAELMRELGRYGASLRTAVVRAIAIERWSNRYRFCPACGTVLIWTRDAIAKIWRPYFDTIARRLIDTWLNRQSNR